MKSKFLDKFFLFAIRALGSISNLLASLLIAREEGVELGRLFLVSFTLIQVFTILARYGAEVYILKAYSGSDLLDARPYYTNKAVVSVVGCFLFVFYVFLIWSLDYDPSILIAYSLAGVSIVVNARYSIIFLVAQAKKRFSVHLFGLNVLFPLVLFILYLLIKVVDLNFREYAVAACIIAASFILALFGNLYQKMFFESSKPRIFLSNLTVHLKSNFSVFGLSVLTQLLTWLPYFISVFMVDSYSSNMVNIIQRFAVATSIISSTINGVSLPLFYVYAKNRDADSIFRIYRSNAAILSVISGFYVVCASVFVICLELVPRDALFVIPIMFLGYWLNCSTSTAGYVLQGLGLISILNKCLLFMVMALPILSYFLISEFGLYGVAVSSLFAVAGINLIIFPVSIYKLRALRAE